MTTNSRPQVLIFSVTYFPFIGGAEVALKEIIARLPAWQFDLITAKISPDLSDKESHANLTIHRVGQGNKFDKYLFPARAFLFARKLQRKKNYAIVWAMLETYAGLAALLFKLKFKQIKYLLSMQSGDSDWFILARTWFWYPLYKMIFTRADHIQAISHWLSRRARRYGYQGEISVIPNGVDFVKMQNPANPSEIALASHGAGKEQGLNLKKELNIPSENKIIFTASRLVRKNNIELLISSCNLLVTRYSLPITLLIAGAGKLENKLKKLVTELKLTKNIIFLGQVSQAELPVYYACADVFARPSFSEGLGNSFLEAMAAGTPIIGSPVGGIPDFLIDNETGLFCDPASPEDLAAKLKLLLVDEVLARKLATNGAKLAAENYDWRSIAQKMEKIFNKLIS